MAEGDQVRDESSDFGRDGARGRASEVRQSTRELEEGSVWPEEVHGGRNRCRSSQTPRRNRRKRRGKRAPRVDYLHEEVEEIKARRTVVLDRRGDDQSGGAMARKLRWKPSRAHREVKKKRGRWEVAAQEGGGLGFSGGRKIKGEGRWWRCGGGVGQ
jgi:hypothetical protein